jgi:hypothetical protein
VRVLFPLLLAAAAAAQSKPEIDWNSTETKLENARKAIAARDMKAADAAVRDLYFAFGTEMQKSQPSPEDRLRQLETLVSTSKTRNLLLGGLAVAAVEAKDWAKAEAYGRECLAAPGTSRDSVHACNTVLGLAALQRNELANAKEFLLASIRDAKKSNLMDRWGPNTALAAGLLARGELETVLTYFESAKSVVSQNRNLDEWIAFIKGGATPDLSRQPQWPVR